MVIKNSVPLCIVIHGIFGSLKLDSFIHGQFGNGVYEFQELYFHPDNDDCVSTSKKNLNRNEIKLELNSLFKNYIFQCFLDKKNCCISFDTHWVRIESEGFYTYYHREKLCQYYRGDFHYCVIRKISDDVERDNLRSYEMIMEKDSVEYPVLML